MRVAMFSVRGYERPFLEAANVEFGHELTFFEPTLQRETVGLAMGYEAACAFVHDVLDAGVLLSLQKIGVRLVVLRCAGFNNVDVAAAEDLGMTVLRVPTYSPCAVAEHAVAMILTLNRRLHRAYARVREGNLSLDGLLGFELRNKVVGVVGTGQIGAALARILHGFGCKLLAFDARENDEVRRLGAEYVPLDRLFSAADVISLHVPLTPGTRHIVNSEALARMKRGVMLINTSRGKLIDTRAVIEALKSGKVGYLGLDVYEEEADLFFKDLSNAVIQDDVFARLMTFPNVLITAHQGFFTEEALGNIAQTTLRNISDFENGCVYEANHVTAAHMR